MPLCAAALLSHALPLTADPAGGLAASLVLKHFSAITKAFATACEMLLTAVLSNLLAGTVLTFGFYVAFLTVAAPDPAPCSPRVRPLPPSHQPCRYPRLSCSTTTRPPPRLLRLQCALRALPSALSRCVRAPTAARPRRYELLPREPDTPPPDVEVVVEEGKQEELHHRRQSSA